MDWQLGAEPQICTALPGPTDLPSAQELRRKTGTRTLHERGRETLGSMGQKKALQAAGEELPAGPRVAPDAASCVSRLGSAEATSSDVQICAAGFPNSRGKLETPDTLRVPFQVLFSYLILTSVRLCARGL